MSLIEGVGDEVTFCFAVFFLLVVLVLAWVSTQVSDQPLINVVVLDRATFQRLLSRLSRRVTRLGSATTPNAEETARPANSDVEPESSESSTGSSSSLLEEPSQAESDEQGLQRLSQNDSTGQQSIAQHTQSDEVQSEKLATDVATDSGRTEVSPDPVTTLTTGKLLREESPQHVGQDSDSQSFPSATEESVSPVENAGEEPREISESTASRQPSADSSQQSDGSGMTIRIRFLDDRQRVLQTNAGETIGEFKRRHFAGELAENFAVRFVFKGQELRLDTNTMQSYNVQHNSVIHCVLSRSAQAQQSRVQQRRATEFDLSFLMLPLFGLILALIWYCRFSYRNYFNAMSTFSLIGITFLFFIAMMASWRPQNAPHEHIE